jgi:ADP-ribose pyrophosphatase YjhB (NUDIX family)
MPEKPRPPAAAAPAPDADADADAAYGSAAVGRRYPPRPLVGVGVVVLSGDRVLLIRRARPPRAGEWSLPGGLQRLGETVADAGRREVEEETGLAVAIAGLVDVVDLIERDEADGRIRWHYTLVDLYATCARATPPVPRSDASEARWLALDTLATADLWQETRRVIDRARALRDADRPGLAG